MNTHGKSPLTYADSGVDIGKGNHLVERIAPLAKRTARTGQMGGIGGFGGLFDVAAAGFKDPVLISSTDGVGTKLALAQATGRHGTVGIDLVAMCVNDIVVQGAEPLFFLDYFATSALDVETAEQVIAGIAEGCLQAGCALLGGETAEMPGMYKPGDYDLAGFAVGAAERGALLPQSEALQPGDVLLGLMSSGVHSNGFSLVRKVVERCGLAYTAPAPFDAAQSLGEALLTPTRIYVKSCLAAIAAGGVKALAHITGGGLTENLPRVLPPHLAASLRKNSWQRPEVFGWLQKEGAVAEEEMHRTFNCGIGMVVVVAAEKAEALTALLQQQGEIVSVIGELTARDSHPVLFL